MNRVCNSSNINVDKINYLNDRTVCKSCYNKNRRKNNNHNIIENEISTSQEKPKISKVRNKEKLNINNNNHINPSVPAYENHRHVVVGPSNVGKTYYLSKQH